MRDPNRIPRILGLIEDAWGEVPDQRLCQLLSNLKGLGRQDLFHWEDDALEKALRYAVEHGDRLSNRVIDRACEAFIEAQGCYEMKHEIKPGIRAALRAALSTSHIESE